MNATAACLLTLACLCITTPEVKAGAFVAPKQTKPSAADSAPDSRHQETMFVQYMERVAALRKCCVLAESSVVPEDDTIVLPESAPNSDGLERFASQHDCTYAKFGNVIAFRRRYLVKTFPSVSASELSESLKNIRQVYDSVRHREGTNSWFRQLLPTLSQEEVSQAAKGELEVSALSRKQGSIVTSFLINSLMDNFGLESMQGEAKVKNLSSADVTRSVERTQISYSLAVPGDAGRVTYLIGTVTQPPAAPPPDNEPTLRELFRSPAKIDIAGYLLDKQVVVRGQAFASPREILKGVSELYGLQLTRSPDTAKLTARLLPAVTDAQSLADALETAVPAPLFRYLNATRDASAKSRSALVGETHDALVQQCYSLLEAGFTVPGKTDRLDHIKASELPPSTRTAIALLSSWEAFSKLVRFVLSFKQGTGLNLLDIPRLKLRINTDTSSGTRTVTYTVFVSGFGQVAGGTYRE